MGFFKPLAAAFVLAGYLMTAIVPAHGALASPAPTATLEPVTSGFSLKATPNPSPLPYDKAADEARLLPEHLLAPSAILIDAQSGKVLFEKDANRRMYPASTTKILTALLALENGDLDDQVTAPKDVLEVEPTMYGIQPGERMTLNDALHGLMMRSYNDFAVAIAVHIAGSATSFADMMNQKAVQLGLENSHFVTAHGLPNEDHYTSVSDMAIIAMEAMKYPTFRQISTMPSYHMPKIEIYPEGYIAVNRNLMLPSSNNESFSYPYSIGIKTGYTNSSGHTYVGAASKDGIELIAVVFGTTTDGKWTDTCKLFDYGFATYHSLDIAPIVREKSYTVEVLDADTSSGGSNVLSLIPRIEESEALNVRDVQANLNDFLDQIDSHFSFALTRNEVRAPIKEGDEIAELTIRYPGEPDIILPLVADRDVDAKAGFLSAFMGNDGSASAATPTKTDDLGTSEGFSLANLPWAAICAVAAGLLVVFFMLRMFLRPKPKRYKRSVGRRYYAAHYGTQLPPRN